MNNQSPRRPSSSTNRTPRARRPYSSSSNGPSRSNSASPSRNSSGASNSNRRRPARRQPNDSTSKPTSERRSRRSHGPRRSHKSDRGHSGSTQTNGSHRHRLNTLDRGRVIPELKPGNIRIVTLGGFESIGKNMSAIEIGNDIIIIDCGFQFRGEDTPGIDYIIPNTKYLEDRKDRIRGVVITHGHLDHIGGIPFVFPRIGNPPIYCLSFTKLMIQKRQEEFKSLPPLDIREINIDDRVQLGEQFVRFFGITHTIPDSMGIVVETPYGNIINQADFKLDHQDGEISKEEQEVYQAIGSENNLLLMADSTNVENEGFSTPEWKVHQDLERLIASNKDGRIILGAFASQIDRLTAIMKIAEKYQRHVVLEGRSIRTNLGVAEEAGIFNPEKGTIVSAEESVSIPPHKVLVLSTGSQGEEFAALMRMANKTHKTLAFNERDTVILSSSIVPGNETSVQKLKDTIARSGANIITYRNSEFYVHGSGHGNREELKWLHQTLKPKYFVPQHGHHFMLRLHAKLAQEMGTPTNHVVVPDDGSIIEIQDEGQKLVELKEKAMSDLVTVDGFNIGGMQDVVIRDRQILSGDGIFTVVIIVNSRTGQLRKSPDIVSRGFIYLREERELIQEARQLVQRTVEKFAKNHKRPYNFDLLKTEVTDRLRKLLLKRTAKRPLVIPVLLGL